MSMETEACTDGRLPSFQNSNLKPMSKHTNSRHTITIGKFTPNKMDIPNILRPHFSILKSPSIETRNLPIIYDDNVIFHFRHSEVYLNFNGFQFTTDNI